MRKVYLISIITIIALVLTMTLASAAVTVVNPVAGVNYSSAIEFHITYVNKTDITMGNATCDGCGINVTLWYNLTSGGGAWNAINATTLGVSDNWSDVYFVLPIATLTDGTYRFNVTVGNNSAHWATSSATTTPVIIDDVAPTVSMGVTPTKITPGRVVEYYATLTDGTGTTVSGIRHAICTATDPEGSITTLGTSTTTALTLGTSEATRSYVDARKEGTYKFNCSVYDTAGNSAFTQKNVTTESVGSVAPYVVAAAVQQQQSKTNGLIIVVILAVIAYLLFKGNK